MKRVQGQRVWTAFSRLTIVVVSVIPVVWSLRYVVLYASEAPFADVWSTFLYLDRFYSGQMTVADYFSQHNEHRIITLRVLLFWLGWFTDFDAKIPVFVTWGLLLITWGSIVLFLVKDFNDLHRGILVAIPAAWLLMSPRQLENLLIDMQICLAIMAASFVGALLLLARRDGRVGQLALAAVLGIVSSFSFGSGLLIWPVGAVLIAVRAYLQRSLVRALFSRPLILWCSAGLATLVLYFWGWQRPPQSVATQEPASPLAFWLTMLGAPLAVEARTSMAVGLLLLVAYAITISRAYLQRQDIASRSWLGLGLMLFAVSSTLMTTSSRAVFGLDWALTPRYTLTTGLGIAGLVMLLSDRAIVGWRTAAVGLCLLSCLLVPGIFVTYRWAETTGATWHRTFTVSEHYLRTYRLQAPETFASMTPDPQEVLRYAPILEARRLSVFRQPRYCAAWNDALSGRVWSHLDTVNGQPVIPSTVFRIDRASSRALSLSGWIATDESQAPDVCVVFDGTLSVPAFTKIERPDVAAFFSLPSRQAIGFIATLASDLLTPGRHVVSIIPDSGDPGAASWLIDVE